MIKSTKQFLLAGASTLAILAGAAEANGEILIGPGQQLYVAPVTGEYAITVLGAGGGGTFLPTYYNGGLGAELTGDVFVQAGQVFYLVAGGEGGEGHARAGVGAV